MVTINGFNFVNQAIDSIKTNVSYKVRVMDNGSTENKEQEYKAKGVDYIRYDSQVSLSECWNKAIQLSLDDRECQYIFNPNDDVIFHEKTIDELIKFMDKSGYLMVTGNNIAHFCDRNFTNFVWNDDSEFDLRPITNWREEGPDFSCYMINRDFVNKVGYFDENYNPSYKEDWDMHTRILLSGNHAKRISSAPYYHFGSQTAKNNPTKSIGSFRTAGYHMEKWGSLDHGGIMDGKVGYKHPYNDSSKDWKFWKGSNKYD